MRGGLLKIFNSPPTILYILLDKFMGKSWKDKRDKWDRLDRNRKINKSTKKSKKTGVKKESSYEEDDTSHSSF